jgi:4-coumarate--CoA ligase
MTTVLFVDVASGKKWTYNSLRDTAEQFGKGLQAKWNLQKGDIIATMTPNTVDVIPVIFGTILVGGIVCPLSFTYTVDELVASLKQSKAKALVTNMACLGVALQTASKVGMPLDHVLLVGQSNGSEKVKHFSSLQSASGTIRKVAIDPRDDLAYLVYSSGTTGLPKGVMLTHHNMVANAAQMKATEVSSSDALNWKTDKSIGFLPMYHIYGTFLQLQSHCALH